MKSKVKNFFLSNMFRLIMLGGMLGVFIFRIVEFIVDANTGGTVYFYFSTPYEVVVMEMVINLIICLLPIIFVIYRIIKKRNETFVSYSIVTDLVGGIFLDLIVIFLYFVFSYLVSAVVFIGPLLLRG